MKRVRTVTLGAVVALAGAAGARGDAVNLKEIPADAKWLVHFDVDTIRGSKVWGMALDRVDKESNGEAKAKLEAVSTLLGSRLPDDVHSVTLVGRGVKADGKSVAVKGVMIVHAKMDREKLTALAQLNAGYATVDYGDHKIAHWKDEDKGQTMYGSFASDSVLVLSSEEEDVRAQLDLMGGKGKGFAGEGAVAAVATKGAGALLYVAGEGLSELQGAAGVSPVLGQIESAWLAIAETPTDLVAKAGINAKTAETANQLRAMGDGVKALVALAGGNAIGEQKLVSDIVGRASLSASGKAVTLEWPVSLETLQVLANKAKSKAEMGEEKAKEAKED